jgi:cell division FtsZ-interacting protein ZapD
VQKKFRHRGNKEGALNAFRALESAGLGKLKTEEKDKLNHLNHTAQVYVFEKAGIDQDNLDALAVKLSQFGVSLTQYQKTLQQKDIIKS